MAPLPQAEIYKYKLISVIAILQQIETYLIGRVIILFQVGMRQRIFHYDTFIGIERQHFV